LKATLFNLPNSSLSTIVDEAILILVCMHPAGNSSSSRLTCLSNTLQFVNETVI